MTLQDSWVLNNLSVILSSVQHAAYLKKHTLQERVWKKTKSINFSVSAISDILFQQSNKFYVIFAFNPFLRFIHICVFDLSDKQSQPCSRLHL